MVFKSRRFSVWLISLGAVLIVYLLYSWLSGTPKIDIGTGSEFTHTVPDGEVDEFDNEMGRIGDVGVGTIRKAKYIHLNANKEVDREFGFEKLLHEVGDEWEIEKPYMNIFQHDFKCHITADRGKVIIETAVGRPSPKDAVLTGNVVAHIVPESGSDIQESFIYLDEVFFISEKSQFSTVGPVKFTSKDAQMLGRGLELVYNDELNRLELLRIIHLDSLRLKNSQINLLSSAQTDVPQKAKALPETNRQVAEQKEGERYRCLFSKNVVIDTPEYLIFADEISVNNIVSSEKSTKADAGSTDSAGEFKDITKENVTSGQTRTAAAGADNVEAGDVSVAKHGEPGELDEQFVDIVVTCDDGIIVVPMDSPKAYRSSADSKRKATSIDSKTAKILDDANGRSTFVAQRIDHCIITGNTVAGGLSELTFYTDDMMGDELDQTAVPVKITARKKAEFLPALNQVIFEGDSLCKMLREDSGIWQKYTLSAPKLTVYLSRDKDEQLSDSDVDIEHVTAAGGVVRLASIKTAGGGPRFAKSSQSGNLEKLLGGIELKCRKFDYDYAQSSFLATGPGVIKVDNSQISERGRKKRKLSKFSFQRPSYALVENFDTLEFFLKSNRIIADAESHQIHIGYVPVIEGECGQAVKATAGRIEAFLHETADGQTELSTLSATGGITYEEEGKKKKWSRRKDIQFVGGEFFYDADKSVITARGDESQACYFNGVLVDGIKYNLRTGEVKDVRIVGPGTL